LLLTTVIFIPFILNKIPLAALAAILILTGWKLAKPAVFMGFWRAGKYQFIPFIVTVIVYYSHRPLCSGSRPWWQGLIIGVGAGILAAGGAILHAT
jgi:MFS superfamily sulfate permease-like transporter